MASTKADKNTEVAEAKVKIEKSEKKKEEKPVQSEKKPQVEVQEEKKIVKSPPREKAEPPKEEKKVEKKKEEKPKSRTVEEEVEEEEHSDEEFEVPKPNGHAPGGFRGRGRGRGAGYRGRGDGHRGRGGYRGRGQGDRGFQGRNESQETDGQEKAFVPHVYHTVRTHPTNLSWSNFATNPRNFRTKEGDTIAHFWIESAPTKPPVGGRERPHPQESLIRGPFCLAINGNRGGDWHLIRGRTVFISNRGERPVIFTTSTEGGKDDKGRLKFLDRLENGALLPGQTMMMKVGRALPNHFYYQDAEFPFLGGAAIVQKNFGEKRHQHSRTGGSDSDSDSDERRTNY